uniref:Solute carrier family 3 member 2 N-terminal domain-containing protein n=1 Tax=Anopheles quadriannulatus TaxID=34691 RepID=A0A182XHL6_ANOQN
MTINERTTLLPKEYQKTYSIAIPQDDLNNNVSNITDDNGVLCEYDSYALTKDELNKYIDDPWWIKMRYCCFATCWIVCLIALAISLYIAADALQHDVCLTPLTNNGTSLGPADLSISITNAIPLVADGAVSTPPSSIVFTLLNQPTS